MPHFTGKSNLEICCSLLVHLHTVLRTCRTNVQHAVREKELHKVHIHKKNQLKYLLKENRKRRGADGREGKGAGSRGREAARREHLLHVASF